MTTEHVFSQHALTRCF